jgi:hypothetical protein
MKTAHRKIAAVILLCLINGPMHRAAAAVQNDESGGTGVYAGRQVVSQFLVTGYGFTDFASVPDSPSTFTTGVNPIFLWQPKKNLLFRSELEVMLNSDSTDVSLEYADVLYSLNGRIILGAGKFISPFGIFNMRFHPKWINIFTDKPLGIEDATMIEAESQIGFQVNGGFPVGSMRGNYAFYVSNGPSLKTGVNVPAGTLSFSNSSDNNDNKAFGGRIGFLPLTGLEAGYSFETSKAGARDTVYSDVGAMLQGVDLSWICTCKNLRGTVRFIAEDIWSHVDTVNYGTGIGTFTNDRNAWYAEVAYRPSLIRQPVLKNFEGAFRADHISQPAGAPGSTTMTRYSWALDYWFDPRVVGKLTYERTYPEGSGSDNSYIAEFAIGF